nr:MAG TPA: hypothetical protein [Caudoviricetes sp.]
MIGGLFPTAGRGLKMEHTHPTKVCFFLRRVERAVEGHVPRAG